VDRSSIPIDASPGPIPTPVVAARGTQPPSATPAGAWLAPGAVGTGLIAILAAVGVALAFGSGGYLPRFWLPVLMGVAGLALVLLLAGPPVRWTRAQVLLAGAFTALSLWTAASLIWAGSPGNAWEEANRTFLYLLGFLLSAAAVSWSGERGTRMLAGILLGAICVVVAALALELATSPSLVLLFTGGRLHFPITYWNGLAALLMMGFWLALGMAGGRADGSSARTTAGSSRASATPTGDATARGAGTGKTLRHGWARPLLLATAVTLVELALLPQSRGAFWTFFMVTPAFVALSSHRFRALFHLALVFAATALAWSHLMAVYHAVGGGGGVAEIHAALWAILATSAGAGVVAACARLVEIRVGRLPSRWVQAIGIALAAVILVTAGVGAVALEKRVGDLGSYAHRIWSQFVADRGPSVTASAGRFSDVGLNGRLQTWQLSVEAFQEHPVLGLGAQNFEAYFYAHRTTELSVRQPHSQPIQILGELGLPGFLLYLLAVAGVMVRAVALRVRSTRPERAALLATLAVAALSWFIHSSADWLWQLGGVTWPAILILGALLGARDGQPGLRASPRARTWRLAGVVLVLLMLASGTVSYLALKYADASQLNAALSPSAAVRDARAAGRLDPFSALPPIREAEAYAADAARSTAAGQGSGQAALDSLALACAAWDRALAREPDNWVTAYRAGMALLDYHDAAVAAGRVSDAYPMPSVNGLRERSVAYLRMSTRLNPRGKEAPEALKQIDGS
jgi:hypothetical protein